MSATKKTRSKRKVKRAGAKALRSDNHPNTHPRRDGAAAPGTEINDTRRTVNMTTFDIFQTAEIRERYTVNAESFEEALRLHMDGCSTFKDSETLSTEDIRIENRETGESKAEAGIITNPEDA